MVGALLRSLTRDYLNQNMCCNLKRPLGFGYSFNKTYLFTQLYENDL